MHYKIKYLLLTIFLFSFGKLLAQESNISKAEVTRIETYLASDALKGRALFTPEIDSASAFIEQEFSKAKLSYFGKLNSFKQEFKAKGKMANNVVGVIKGKSKPEEYVVFSGHFDHLGNQGEGEDKIFNGANDDASGVTAVIALANYFQKWNQNERTLIFVAFTGEETGGFGSYFFSKSIDTNKIVAMFNLEMIGTHSKWGKDSAYITGYEMSDFGKILQQNLTGSHYTFYPDPYPDEHLFYRSDNAKLAVFGVPAHTISTSKMDTEPNYHKVTDEVSTLDLDNMTRIIEAIAKSSISIIQGKDTPTRLE